MKVIEAWQYVNYFLFIVYSFFLLHSGNATELILSLLIIDIYKKVMK